MVDRHASRSTVPPIARSPVALAQLRVAGAVLVAVVAAQLAGGYVAVGTPVVLGMLTLGFVTVVATAFDWTRHEPWWGIALPVADMAVLSWLSWPTERAGFAVLLALPTYWLAAAFATSAGWVGTAAAGVALWLPRAWAWATGSGRVDMAAVDTTVAVTVVLAVELALTYGVRVHAGGQAHLLHRQAERLESALDAQRSSTETLQQILDAVDFGVVSFDLDGHVVGVNQTLTAAVIGTETLYAADGTTPLPPQDAPHRRALRGDAVENVIYWVGPVGEERHAYTVTVRATHDATGRRDRLVLVARDVTVEMQALRARDDLVSSVSHELRTPLSSIIGFLDLVLEEPGLAEEPREMLERALGSADRMLSLVNDMQAARGPRARQLSLTLTEVDLAEILRDAVAGIRPRAADRLITVTLDAPDRLPLLADPLRLRQIADNLLVNAVKYNRDGGTIAVTAAHAAMADGRPGVRFEVTDTGRGMTPAEQLGLFERFYRAESVRGSAIHGTGLGLSIVRDLVTRHGGEVGVSSVAGEGSTFSVILPASDGARASGVGSA